MSVKKYNMSKTASRRAFKRGTRYKGLNIPHRPMRGGIRL